ncbi:MAG: hypothetical protein HQ541_19315, partial [Mariniphaga sp.]|nr:hypothetical protein [Mariniphaga sp.]
MSKKNFIFIPVVIIAGIVVYFTMFQPDEVLTPNINSFEECVSADYPVMESYPRQCKTLDGRSFTEDIGDELEKIDLIRVNNPRPNQI